MFRPNDLQLVLLTSAAGRIDGSLLPPPESVGGQATRIRRAIPPLIKNGLVSEAEIADAALAWRQDGETCFGAFITDAGRTAIGVGQADDAGSAPIQPPEAAAPAAADAAAKKQTKASLLLEMLRREQGATLDELIAATGWLPHTTRAALTGLRKKGHGIAKGKRGEITCYSVGESA